MPPFFSWGNLSLLPRSPSGHSSAQAQLLYQWLYGNYFGSIPGEKTNILWSGPFYIFLFLVILAVLLWVYILMANDHRKHSDLYGVESFGGYILERIGIIDLLTWAITIICILWSAYFFITMLLYGQVY